MRDANAAHTGSRVELAGALAAPELPPITQNA
jgi:hypothetical protein